MGQGWNAGEYPPGETLTHGRGKLEKYSLAIGALISQNEREKGVEGDSLFFSKGE